MYKYKQFIVISYVMWPSTFFNLQKIKFSKQSQSKRRALRYLSIIWFNKSLNNHFCAASTLMDIEYRLCRCMY